MFAELQSEVVHPIHFIGRPEFAPPALTATCSSCHLKDLCLPCGLGGTDVERLDRLMFARRRVKMGEALFRQGEAFQFVYAVRSGTFKSGNAMQDGREQVTGFHLAGDVLGLDGLADGRHASEAIALEDSEICAIPYRQLAELAARNPNMQRALTQMLSRQIVGEQRAMMLLASLSAEERVASFVLGISRRMEARGYSSREFHLRMSRAEIGSYLGLTLETVSRAFSSLQQQGLVEVAKKHIRILDLDTLTSRAEPSVH